jgi:hypothetical protein
MFERKYPLVSVRIETGHDRAYISVRRLFAASVVGAH